MSCHGCAETFGFWKRELGCPGCGFAYCKKCLRFKIGEGSNAKTVCSKCYTSQKTQSPDEDGSNAGNSDWKVASQAIRAIQVLESMDNPAKPPITLYRESSNSRLANLKKGLSVDDQRLVERLEELSDGNRSSRRRKSDQLPEDELAVRLAKLKGEELPQAGPHTIDGKSILLTQKPETELELLKRLSKQAELQKNYEASVVDDIEARLARLKGEPMSSPSGSGQQQRLPDKGTSLDLDEEMPEEEQVEQIISRYVAEVALESQSKDSKDDNDDGSPPLSDAERGSDDSDEDLEYDKLCHICEEKRAIFACEECDGDIFCKKCFKEFHDELGESHDPAPIRRSEDEL